MQHLESAAFHPVLTRWLRGTAATVLTLAAPAVSVARAFTTGLSGTAPAVRFPPGYWVTLRVPPPSPPSPPPWPRISPGGTRWWSSR